MTTHASRLGVLGAGSWGTALALALAENGHRVLLWAHDPAVVAIMSQARVNARYLPDIPFPPLLQPEADLARVAREVDGVMVVVPSHAFRQTLRQLHDAGPPRSGTVAWGTKGLEPGSGRLLSTVVADELPGWSGCVVSGPSFAADVARALPTALTAASSDAATAQRVAEWLRSDRLRVYTSDDPDGVQLGGAIKNVMAIAAGVCDGLALGASARAALITRGLAELCRLGEALGGRAETFMGLAGVGDLILTCTDDKSRNRRLGLGVGRGGSLDEVLAELAQEAEGVGTVRELHAMARRLEVAMPITETVYRILFEGLSAHDAVRELLSREPKSE